jgi:hypothetical protein
MTTAVLPPQPGETTSMRVRPVYLPVGQMEERLCIALVGVSEASIPWARSVLSKPLSGLPNDVGHACVTFGGVVTADFQEWCSRGSPADLWAPPLRGLALGDWLVVDGLDDEDVVRAAVSLSFLTGREAASSSRGNETTTPRSSDESRFLESVKSEVSRTRPGLTSGFRRTLSLVGRVSAGEIDFVGGRYVTCYAAINPKSRSGSRVQPAFAALWRLARARDAFGFAVPPAIELTAWVPPPGLPIYSEQDYVIADETVAELSEQASREQLSVFSVVDSMSACRRLLLVESPDAPQMS